MKPVYPHVEKRANKHDESEETHPAYGQIMAARVSGTTALYGSDFLHHHFVMIEIHESYLMRSLSRDWPHATRELIRVSLSEAQWARFVSALNTGDGAQCTIDRVDGVARPEIPEPPARIAQFQDELRADLADAIARCDALRADVESSGNMPKGTRQKVLDALHMIRMRIFDSVPYVAKSFDEHVEQTTERARIEINAHLTATVQRAGLTALQGTALFELPERKP